MPQLMKHLSILSPPDVAGYESMTYPYFRPKLQLAAPQGPVIAVGVSENGQPLGLALGEIPSPDAPAEALSLFVCAGARRRGLGTALLSRLESAFAARGCGTIHLVFATGGPATPALERILAKLGWEPPVPRMLLCEVGERILRAGWMQQRPISAPFEIFSWCDLKLEERERILHQQQVQPWFPENLSPFGSEKTIEPLNSLGLRFEGEVVGWIITHRIGPTRIRYSFFFVRKDLRGRRIGLPLLVAAIRRQADGLGLDSTAVFGAWQDNPSMMRFLKRQVLPYLDAVRETVGASKTLVPPRTAADTTRDA